MDTKRLEDSLNRAFDAQLEALFNQLCNALVAPADPDLPKQNFKINLEILLEAEQIAIEALGLGPKPTKKK